MTVLYEIYMTNKITKQHHQKTEHSHNNNLYSEKSLQK